MTATTTNPTTGVQYYTEGPLEGQSVALFVPVTNGQVRNPNGVRWPFLFGAEHDQAADYYRLVPFTSVSYDTELFVIDSENSGWGTHPARNAEGEPVTAPDGHPKGEYKYTETLRRRSVAELKTLAKGYADRYNAMLWPQENGYPEKLQYAKEQVAANNRLAQFTGLLERHEELLKASFHNDARLAQLYAEIEVLEDKAITNAVATATTATLTFDVAHGIAVGKRIAVKDLPAPFATLNGGSFVVTEVTNSSPFTLSYELIGSAITTAAVAAGVVTPVIDFIVGQMATQEFPEGWVNGIPE
jgi:hypothetical protein